MTSRVVLPQADSRGYTSANLPQMHQVTRAFMSSPPKRRLDCHSPRSLLSRCLHGFPMSGCATWYFQSNANLSPEDIWEARLTFGVGVDGVGACLKSSRGQHPRRSSGAATLGPNNSVIYDRETQIHSTTFHIAPPHNLNQVRMLVLVLSSPPEMMSWWLPSCQHPPALELNIA